LWRLLVDEDRQVDGVPSWIESWLRGLPSGAVADDPAAAALQRLLATGVDVDDLTDVVRTMQHEIIYNVCQLLDDPYLLGIELQDLDPIPASDDLTDGPSSCWELMAVRTTPPERVAIVGLHAELDQHDPTGRYGESRGRPIPAQLPDWPEYARLSVAQARAGDRKGAIMTWRKATGTTPADAKAALDALLRASEP
jgi:hypothetical protein